MKINKKMIRAGLIEEIIWNSGSWIFVDIGFSNKAKSCGILIENNKPSELMFNEACLAVKNHVKQSDSPINLVIEAPLSVSFDKEGNPKGRKIEKQKGKTRYWCVGPGCVVMVATQYLLNEIENLTQNFELRLFEGFVSFKKKEEKTNHSRDVILLREVVMNPVRYDSSIISGKGLKMDSTDILSSAFELSGRDYGIPPVIKIEGL